MSRNSNRPSSDTNADDVIPAPEFVPIAPASAAVVDRDVLEKRLRLIDRKLTEFNLRPDFVEEARAILAGQRDDVEEAP